MKYQRIIYSGLMIVGLSSLLGCRGEHPTSFADIPGQSWGGVGMASGDFDGDGDLDLIVGSTQSGASSRVKFYYFQNDGKGNLSQYQNNGKDEISQ